MSNRETVIDILMRRDGMTKEEATELVQEVRGEIDDVIAAGDYAAVEDIMYSDLGLEMDYIHDILF